MAGNVHPLLDAHRLVEAGQRTLDEVVALAVAVDARLLGPAVLAHEGVVGVQTSAQRVPGRACQRCALRIDRELQLLLQLGRCRPRRPSVRARRSSRQGPEFSMSTVTTSPRSITLFCRCGGRGGGRRPGCPEPIMYVP